MKNITTHITLVLATTLGLSACNFRKVEKQSHEGAKQTEFVTETRDDLVDIQSDPNWLKNIYDDMTKKNYSAVIRQASSILSDEKKFEELDSKKVNDGIALLGYYNYSLLENFKASKTDAGADAYLKWALKGCEKDLRGCESLNFLKRDQRSVSVITEILKLKEKTLKIDEYYKIIQLGFEVNNRLRTVELEMMYILRGKEYFEYLNSLGKVEAENKERHAKLFQIILSQNVIDKKDAKISEWLKKLEPWRYSAFDKSYTQLGSVKVFEVAAKGFIYEDKKLSPGLKQVINDLKSTKDSLGMSFHDSVLEIQEDIAKGNDEAKFKALSEDEKKKVRVAAVKTNVLKNFKINIEDLTSDSFYNEYFYVVDRLYRGHLGLEEANLFWEGTEKRQDYLDRTIRLYFKFEFLKMLFNTNIYMGNIFKQKDIPNEKLFDQVVNRSQTINDEWSMFLSRVETMAIFAKQKSNGRKSIMDDTEGVLRSISRNVKYLSIYPNMMVINDIMIDQEAEIKVKSFWGMDFKVTPKEVMKDMINGKIDEPWFIFGGDSAPINKTETIFSYYFGLESGVFDTFSIVTEDAGIKRSSKIKFFQNAVKRTLSEETSKLKKMIETMENMNSNNDVEFQNIMATCDLVKKGDLDFELKFAAEDLQKYLLFGNLTNATLNKLYSLYISGPISEYRGVRDDYESLNLQISSMMEILAQKLNSESDKQIIEELRKEIASYEDLKVKFFNVAVDQHKKASDCLNKLVLMERDRTLAVYELEAEHFGKVFDEADKLRKITDAKSKKDAQDALKTAMKMGVNDSVTDNQYTFSHWSLISRVMGYSQTLKPSVTFDLPDQQGIDGYNLKAMVVPFRDIGTKKQFTRDEFISYGLRTIQATSKSSFQWITSMIETQPLILKMESVMSLYNLSFDIEGGKAKGKITANDILAEAKNILSLIGISEREAKVLQLMKMKSRETKDKLVGILFDSPDSEFKGILDSSFEKWIQVENDMNEAADFHKAMANLEKFVFPVPAEVSGILESKYRNKVKAMDSRLNDILGSLMGIEKSTKASDFVIRYELNDGQRGMYSPDMIQDGNYRLISAEVLKNAQRKINNFHNVRTGECFKEQTTAKNCFSKQGKR
tara:strand:- start:77301 stop:80654 length:3354 start_codon:yes stop_codon:yes gene_type:complete